MLFLVQGPEREYFVEQSVLHPCYDPETVDNDVALLRIPEDDHHHGAVGAGLFRRLPDQPNAACLPDPGRELPPPGAKCTIIGWGKKKNSDVYGTDVLHEAQVKKNSEGGVFVIEGGRHWIKIIMVFVLAPDSDRVRVRMLEDVRGLPHHQEHVLRWLQGRENRQLCWRFRYFFV